VRLAVAAGLLLLAPGAFAAAPEYALVPAQSTLTFVGVQQGEKFTGKFPAFTARVRYAPGDLAGSSLEATIEVPKLDTASQDRDQALAGGEWFDFAKYPTASFRTVAIRPAPKGAVADAQLSIKGHTRRILFPFTWTASATGAVLDARVTLDRLEFGLGAGEWADESIIGRTVEVAVHLVLVPVPTPAPAPVKPPARKTG
jgi:polyisoprenoid-binding protein YceI